MRFHVSKEITSQTISDVVGKLDGVVLDGVVAHASRSADHAYEVSLLGTAARHTRTARSGHGRAATYEDWGWLIADLYEIDPAMQAGPYRNVGDFDSRTRYAFVRAAV